MTAAMKNKIAKLGQDKSISIADHGGAEVTKIGKGSYTVNGQPTGNLEKTIIALDGFQDERLAEAMQDSQVAAAEQRLDDEAAAGGRDNNEPQEPNGISAFDSATEIPVGNDEQAADPTPDAEPGDNADEIAAAAPAAEWPTAALSDEPLTETAVATAPGLKTLTPAAIMVAAPGLPSRPLPALIRLGAGGDPKARYYPGEIVSFDPAADGLVSVRLTGKDRAENRPFQLLREKQTDGTTEITAQHKVSRRTICIGAAAFDALMALKPKRTAAAPPSAVGSRQVRVANDIETLQKQLAAALITLQKAKDHHASILKAIELNQAAAAAPADEPTETLRAEAEAKGVTFSAPTSDPATEPDPATGPEMQATPVITDAGEFGAGDDDTTPEPPQPQTPPQTEEFAGNDAPAPAEYEIVEGGYQPDTTAGSMADAALGELERERVEDDIIEDEQYHAIDRDLIAA